MEEKGEDYRICSFKRRGALLILRASDAALIRGRRSIGDGALIKIIFVNYNKNFNK